MEYNRIEIICNILSIATDPIDMNDLYLKLKKKNNNNNEEEEEEKYNRYI